MRKALVLLGAVAALGSITSGAHAEEAFFKGKTLRVIVNFAAGGAADAEGRLFAMHISRLIDGNPTILAQNVPGSGGMTGTNYVGNAPKDGSVLGYLTGAGARAALQPDLFQVDFRKFQIVGYNQGSSIYYVRTDVKPSIKEPADLLNATGIFAGGINAGSSKDLTMRLTLQMLGVKHNYITGYSGAGPIRIAFERGEVNMLSDGRATYNTSILPMVKSSAVLPVYVDTGFDGEKLFTPRGNRDMDIPPFHVFYRKHMGKDPSGVLWDAYLALLSSNTMLQRIIAFPPGTPDAAVDALRDAVSKLDTDPEWKKGAEKVFGFVPEYETGDDIQTQVTRMLHVKPEIRDFILKYIEQGQSGSARDKK